MLAMNTLRWALIAREPKQTEYTRAVVQLITPYLISL